MALQSFANKMGVMLMSVPQLNTFSVSGSTVDAAGESSTTIGKIYLEGGTGTKTISSSGGKIRWRNGATTFANAGTNLRIGIQDVGATGIEDGTFDVYADLVGGTDSITANVDQITAMETGTKNLTHGDTIAISFEFTTRGGADSIVINGWSSNLPSNFNSTNQFPYRTNDTGSGPAKSGTGVILAMIEFDDGTLGWIEPFWFMPGYAVTGSLTLNTGTNPDEAACSFQVPFKCSIHGAYLSIGSIATTDTFEIILYSDPLGTPVAEQTVTVDPNFTAATSATGSGYYVSFTAEILSPNTWYAIALRPTSANSLNLGYTDMGSGNDKYMRPSIFGENLQLGGRQNQTGAFTEIQTYYFPIFGIMVDQLDDGVSTGGFIGIIGGN